MSNLVVENYNLNNYTGYVDPDMVDNPLDQSPLYFKVHREQLVGDTHINRVGMPFQYRTPLYGLFRDNGEFLGAHTEKYSVMENETLFKHVQGYIVDAIQDNKPELLENVTVNDKASYNGAISMREFIFNNILYENETNNGHKTSNALRLIILNSFDGKTPVKVYGGNIDFFCLNGMILGSFDAFSKRHTKNMQVGNLTAPIEQMFLNYFKFTNDMFKQSQKYLDAERGRAFIEKCFEGMDRKTSNMLNQYDEEIKTRGHNVWALTSALTSYGSGNSSFFSSKNTENDHQHFTTLKRQGSVQNILNSTEYRELVAA